MTEPMRSASQIGRGGRVRSWTTGTAVAVLACSGIGAAALTATSVASTPKAALSTVMLKSSAAPDVSRSVCNRHGGCGPQVKAPVLLTAGQEYKIQVIGTIGVWDDGNYKCGKPEAAPAYPTGSYSTPTSDDAQFRFAAKGYRNYHCPPSPRKETLFQMNLGAGWFHPIAVNDPTKPSGDAGGLQHPYTFLVTGDAAKPKFRYVDFHPSDNHGAFKIVISP